MPQASGHPRRSIFRLLSWTTRLDKILETVEPGDLICFHRGIFVHHAVYVGSGRAVHHHLGPADGEIIEATVEYLAKGDLMRIVKVNTAYSPEEVVRRARSQIGPRPYCLRDRNCEHFTSWVYYDAEASTQIERLSDPELQLLKVVKPKGRPADALPDDSDAIAQNRPTEGDAGGESDSFVFVPPRPVKYRHTSSRVRVALNHARSFAKVLTLQTMLAMAAVPYRRCGDQAAGLRWLRARFRVRDSGDGSSESPEAPRAPS